MPSTTLNVFLTVDTEFWPRREYRNPSDYLDDFYRDIYGRTKGGDFGLRFQLDLLNMHGLRATFFAEALSAYVVGSAPLREIIHIVGASGHDVQLHLHTEWLKRMPESILPGRLGQHMRNFSEDEQTLLVSAGIARMRECGADAVCAFRAGNYGADFRTLCALSRNGVTYDTSYNVAYLGSACGLVTHAPLSQPVSVEGVWEYPISFFRDFRGHRAAQLAACSSREIEYALLQAWRRGWYSFVLVLHSFELIQYSPTQRRPVAKVDSIVLRRFERLCRFLGKHADKFRTATFSDLPKMPACVDAFSEPLRVRAFDSSLRLVEQLMRRL